MAKLRILRLAGLAALGLSTLYGPQAQAQTWRLRASAGEPPMQRWIAETRSGMRRVVFIWAEFPVPLTRMRVTPVGRQGALDDVYERTGCAGDLILSGGFFDYDGDGRHQPIGLVIADGRTVSPTFAWTTGGAIVQGADGVRIVGLRDLSALTDADQALQSKPIVVRNGRNDMVGEDGQQADRVVIGVTENGDLFAAILGSATLYETAEILTLLKAAGGAPVKDALALDGGPSAHAYLPKADRHFGSSAATYVPNVVCFERAQPS